MKVPDIEISAIEFDQVCLHRHNLPRKYHNPSAAGKPPEHYRVLQNVFAVYELRRRIKPGI